jgi:hypothetical protein
MQEKKEQTTYTSTCNKSNKMSDYNIKHINETLYLTNKKTKEIDFVILDVIEFDPITLFFYVKQLLLSTNTTSKYYSFNDLKVRFKDISIQQKFKLKRTRNAKRTMTLSLISVILKRKLIQSKQTFLELTKKSVASVINFITRHSDNQLTSSKQNIKKSPSKHKKTKSLKNNNHESNHKVCENNLLFNF